MHTSHAPLRPGQVYAACRPADTDHSGRRLLIRLENVGPTTPGAPGADKVTVSTLLRDGSTARRRTLDATQLHATSTTQTGQPRRTGYALVASETRPISELGDSGLLWMINQNCFHPRGLDLTLVTDADGTVLGWQLQAHNTEFWMLDAEEGVLSNKALATVRQALASATEAMTAPQAQARQPLASDTSHETWESQ